MRLASRAASQPPPIVVPVPNRIIQATYGVVSMTWRATSSNSPWSMPGVSRSPAKKPNTNRLMRKSTPSSAVNAIATALRLMGGRFTSSALPPIELPACLDDASNRVRVAGRTIHEHRVRFHREHRYIGRTRRHVAAGETHRVLSQESRGRAYRLLLL